MQQTLFFAEGGILTTSKKRAFAHEVLQDLDNSQEAAMEQPTKKMKLTCDYSVSALSSLPSLYMHLIPGSQQMALSLRSSMR